MTLTGDVRASLKLGSHVGIHCDHDLFLFGHVGVALLLLLADPLPERLADHRGAHVHDPLLGYLLDVWMVREIRLNLRLAGDELEDLLERQVPVHGDVHGLDIRVVDLPLLARQDVLQKVDRDVVCKKRRKSENTSPNKSGWKADLPYGGR